MRSWEISIYLIGPDGEELPANCFDKATYMLHESFGKRAKQSMCHARERAAEERG